MRPGLARQEAELAVAGLTGRVRDAPQRVGHLHPLKQRLARGLVSSHCFPQQAAVARSRPGDMLWEFSLRRIPRAWSLGGFALHVVGEKFPRGWQPLGNFLMLI